MRAWLAIVAARIAGLVRARQLDDDFDRELSSHLEMSIEENIRRGMAPDAARRAAALQIGGATQVKEQIREHRSVPVVDTTLQDIRFGLRMLRRFPAFSLVAVSTLAVGIGAGTVVFSFERAVLLRPLPYRDPASLVRIFETAPLTGPRKVAPANWADWRARNTVFSDIAAYEQFNDVGSGAGDLFLTGFGEPQGLKALGVSGNLFAVLGTPPLMGRLFVDDETYSGRARVVILSYGLWQSTFAGDPNIVGRSITLSGRNYEVVGVMPRTFVFPGRDVQLWTPVAYTAERIAQSRRPHWLGVVARERPSVTLAGARQAMAAVAKALESEYPDTNAQAGVRVEPLRESLAGTQRTALLVLGGAVGLLFLIVCVNIANLQLARAAGRSREFAIRRALGAPRGRLLRQLITESLVLSMLGGSIGLAVAVLTQSALTRYAASAVPLFADVAIDRVVLLFAVALSFVAPMAFAIGPALASTRVAPVNDRSEAGAADARPLQMFLVAGEVALSIILVVTAVLLLRSLSQLRSVDPGFKADDAVAFTVTLPSVRYPNAAADLAAFREIERRLAELPGTPAVGATSTLPLRGFTWTGSTTVEGRGDYEQETRHASTTSGYFAAMGIRLLAGRWFAQTDAPGAPEVTIVNETLAHRYFPGVAMENVVGKRLTFGRPQDHSPWVEIVAVVSDEKQRALDEVVQPNAYSPIAQRMQNPLTFVVRSPEDTSALIARARTAVAEVDKDLALTAVAPLRQVVDSATESERFRATLLVTFAAAALLLAGLGIYGVLTYFVSQRTRELGVRLALGARPSALFLSVVGQGMRPVVVGGFAGLLASAVLTRLAESLLYGVQPLDLQTYAAAVVALTIIALAACAVPAFRATSIDPQIALRSA